MTDNRKPHVLVFRLAAVLLILVMLSSGMVAGRFARYITTSSGSDSARVARFSVTESGILKDTVSVKIVPGQKLPLSVQIQNDSEVAVSYSVSAENQYNNLPLTFTLLDNTTPVGEARLAPGETKNLALQIYWDESITDDKYMGRVDLIRLTLQVNQLD